MKLFTLTLVATLTALFLNCNLLAENLAESIHSLQKQWAIANYETVEGDLEKAFVDLVAKAEKTVATFPNKAEPLIWNAIIVSSDAGKNGGLSALGKVKKARKLLLKAEKINPGALNGSIYTSLGSLYYQVPGWPIGFGNDDEAEKYLKKALSINPNGIDPNFFYGDFMLEEGNYADAKIYLNKALNAPARPERPLADKGRRAEVEAKLKQLEKHL